MFGLDGPRRPPAAGGAPTSLVIFTHGYGSHGGDLLGLSPLLAQSLPNTAWSAPNAGMELPGYQGAYQWFPLDRIDPVIMASGARQAAATLDRFIDGELRRHSLPASACALVGFSQGTMMALQVGLRRTEPLAAIVGFSGVLTAPERLPAELKGRPPVLLIHGEADDRVPVHALAGARDALATAGLGCRWLIEPNLPHAIGEQGIATCGAFLRAAFAGGLAGWTGPASKP